MKDIEGHPLASLMRHLTLEGAKGLAEMLAILGAGTWALFEYGAKAYEDRMEGLQLKRATVQLEATEVEVDDRHAWVHARMRVKNISKRSVTTFMINWWWNYPDRAGTPQISPIRNDTTSYELAPGEESEIDQTLVVNSAHPAVVVHAHVYFQGKDDGTECRFVKALSAKQVEQMTDQPDVCAGVSGKPCAHGCASQAAELLVPLKGLTP